MHAPTGRETPVFPSDETKQVSLIGLIQEHGTALPEIIKCVMQKRLKMRYIYKTDTAPSVYHHHRYYSSSL